MLDETARSCSKRIDVIIPVYNAPVLTRRCIDSVVTHLGESIHRVLIQDDASDNETRVMLDHLPYSCVEVFHAEKNQGFGMAVNTAVSRSDAFYVFVLNSDTEVKSNILPLLCFAFDADPELAAIVPAGNSYDNFDLGRYMLYSGNYIRNYYLRGHAFLIRRDIFLAIGGFDPIFGRGYYEDIDLGRRLDLNGWRFGVHPEAHIYHKKGGSFGDNRRPLSRHNRAVYLSRYPKAQQNILLLTVSCTLIDFDEELIGIMDQIFHDGGYVHWFTPARPSQLTCLQMYNHALNAYSVVRILLRGWKRADRQVTEIWIAPETPFFLRTLLTAWGKWQNLKVLLLKQATK
ncbi:MULTISPECIES: glycosyltransferase family 2 protein [Nitrosomonas]|uniref:glycosyltransferase family 2 protein n=2 Tax=Nitrosomonadaceae TaxID=206379 RepID=UPI000792CC25|nr:MULTISPECIES: glycosyltransferase [Nitrosomonas]KXK49665.1 MAG: glycosyl transferase [Nitrosomonas europaea]MBV6388873.1 hypothetical protein [Nitrosomonas europaea]QOJ08358.1 MAG: glycosyltransferase [Nitrosomonas sp. H1_AOB3]